MYSEFKLDIIIISIGLALFMSGYYVGVEETGKKFNIGVKTCQKDMKFADPMIKKLK